jgi:hypothetical protein
MNLLRAWRRDHPSDTMITGGSQASVEQSPIKLEYESL